MAVRAWHSTHLRIRQKMWSEYFLTERERVAFRLIKEDAN